MGRRHAARHHNARTAARRQQASASAAATMPDATQRDATLRALYTLLAEHERAPEVAEQAAHVETALRSLRTIAPTLHEHPDLLREVQQTLRLAEARSEALAAGGTHGSGGGGGGGGGGVSLLQKSSPTGSTPLADGGVGGGWGTTKSKETPRGVANAAYLRKFADTNPWVHAAIKTRAQQVARADVDILSLDVQHPLARWQLDIQRQTAAILNYPNELRDSYRTLMQRVVWDLQTLDRGCISKSMDARRRPHALYSEDGATIKIYPAWSGNPDEPRYLYDEGGFGGRTVPLRNDELICIMDNEATFRFGMSPVQVLLDTIQADMKATAAAADLVGGKPPQHLVHLKGAGQSAINTLISKYDSDIAGKREIFFTGFGDDVHVFPLMFSLKDNQFLEWQVYLARKICAVFHISPQQIGLTFDVNRATAEVQQDQFEDDGLIPLLLLIEEYLNREFLADFAPLDRDGRPDMDRLNLRLMYPEISEVERMLHAERVLKSAVDGLHGLPVLTPNMALAMLGEEPIPGGNTLWVMTQTNGPLPWLSYDGETGDYGTFAALGGQLGAQDPDGGINDQNDAPRDSTQDKADRSKPADASSPTGSGANGSAGGNDTSSNGSGDAPNLSPAGESGDAGASSSSKQFQPTRRYDARVDARVDARRPGKRWSPALAQSVTRALTGGGGDGVEAAVKTTSSDAKQPKSKSKPVGRVSAEVAAAHTPPYQQRQAQMQLARQVRAVFEAAQQRGQHGG